jgi:hypothetical protein
MVAVVKSGESTCSHQFAHIPSHSSPNGPGGESGPRRAWSYNMSPGGVPELCTCQIWPNMVLFVPCRAVRARHWTVGLCSTSRTSGMVWQVTAELGEDIMFAVSVCGQVEKGKLRITLLPAANRTRSSLCVCPLSLSLSPLLALPSLCLLSFSLSLCLSLETTTSMLQQVHVRRMGIEHKAATVT